MLSLFSKKLTVPVGYELHGEPQEDAKGNYTGTVYTVRKKSK